jgi:hypothetical protein
MAGLFIEVEGHKSSGGYRVIPKEQVARYCGLPGPLIVPVSRPVPYRPLDHFDDLYLRFSNVRTTDELIDFVKKFGLLTGAGIVHDMEPWGDSAPNCLHNAGLFRELLRQKPAGARKLADIFTARRHEAQAAAYQRQAQREGSPEIARTAIVDEALPVWIGEIDVAADPVEGVRLKLRARHLLSALWWQLVQALSGSASFVECHECGQWFATGFGGRRADAKFCSNAHKVQFFSRARSGPSKQKRR